MPEGILNLDKPQGQTSHDVVERVRALTGIRRVGHAGTLDPLATGVLLLCVGRTATRIAEFLMAEPKTYRADARFGITTDTFDAEGEVVSESPVVTTLGHVDRDQIEKALGQFRGSIEQTPPMYSAVKHKGKPLYRLARRGVVVERDPRRVEMYSLDLVAWNPPTCTLQMTCSAGTYVRVLVHDLGQRLGCGAHVTGLTRLASGRFRLEHAVTLNEFAQKAKEGRWGPLICPIDEALADRFPALRLTADAAWRLCSGQAVESGERGTEDGTLARVYGPDDRFLALASYDADGGVWRPLKVFVSAYPRPPSEDDGQG